MRQLAELGPDARRRAIPAAAVALCLGLWLEGSAVRWVSTPRAAEDAVRQDPTLLAYRASLGRFDEMTTILTLRALAAMDVPLNRLTLAKSGQRHAAMAAGWDTSHPSASAWMERVRNPLNFSAAHPPEQVGKFAQISYFRAACAHGAEACDSLPLMMTLQAGGAEAEALAAGRSADAYISAATALRPPMPEAELLRTLGIVRADLPRGRTAAQQWQWKQAAGALEDLAVELARARSGEAVRRHQQELGSVRDIVHDNLFLRLCVGEEELDHADISPQHCRRFRWMILLFRYDTIEWVVGLLVAVQSFRAVFCYEYAPAVQVLLTICVARLLRVTCFVGTTLPLIDVTCRLGKDLGNPINGGCGDYLYSGHAVIQFVGLCMVWQAHLRRRPRWPLPLLLLVSLASLAAVFGYTLERYHYTADVLLAGYLTTATWVGLGTLIGVEPREVRRRYLPLPRVRRHGLGGPKVSCEYREVSNMQIVALLVGLTSASIALTALVPSTSLMPAGVDVWWAGTPQGLLGTVVYFCLWGREEPMPAATEKGGAVELPV